MLIPAPSVRVVEVPDGRVIWLVIPHSLRSLSFLLEAPGTLWCALSLIHSGTSLDQCWLARLDCATGDLSFAPMDGAIALPHLRHGPTGAPFVLAQDRSTLRRAAVQPLHSPAALTWSALPRGTVVFSTLGPDGPLAWVMNRNYRTTHLAVDLGGDTRESVQFALPRGFALLDALPLAGGYALLGKARGGLRCLRLDAALTLLSEEPLAAGDLDPRAILRPGPDGGLLCLGCRGHEIGTMSLANKASPRFTPILRLPVEGLDAVVIQAPLFDPDGACEALFSFRYAGQSKRGTGSLRVEADGTSSYLYTLHEESPGIVFRQGSSERVCDEPLAVDFRGSTADFEVAAFERSYQAPSGYTPHKSQIIRVWKRSTAR
jgi:hypothetical protein